MILVYYTEHLETNVDEIFRMNCTHNTENGEVSIDVQNVDVDKYVYFTYSNVFSILFLFVIIGCLKTIFIEADIVFDKLYYIIDMITIYN
jgi:hypothetical protein